MKNIIAVIALLCVAFVILIEPISLAWLSDNGLSSAIGITGNVHKSYFESGDGTKDIVYDEDGNIIAGPYEIKYPVQLYYFAWLQYLGYFNVDNEGVIDTVYFRISDDIDMDYVDEKTGERYTYVLPPIGTVNNPFLGNFDGEGHTITDLTVENLYGSLLDPPDEVENNFGGAEIIGFFGVIGELSEGDYNYDSSANEVKNVVLENLTVKTQTSTALIGLVAGYVNGLVDCVGVASSTVNIQKGPQALTYTANLSDYALIGYCTNEYKDSVYVMDVVLTNPELSDRYNVVPDMTSDGDGNGWGGSINMLNIYNWITELKNDTPTTDDYVWRRTDVITLDGKTVTVYGETEDKKAVVKENFGSFVFSTANSNVTYVNFIAGAQKVVEFEYAYTENNIEVYYITDGTNYISFNGTSVTNTTNQANATKWYVSGGVNGGKVSVVIDDRVYYLILNGNNVEATAEISPSQVPEWTVVDGDLRIDSKKIAASGNTWSVATTNQYVISRNGNYLKATGTTTFTSVDDPLDATVWTMNLSGNSTTIACELNGTPYYLGINGTALQLKTTTTTWNYSSSNNRFSVRSGRTYYLIYNNGWSASTSGSTTYRNMTLTEVWDGFEKTLLQDSGTTERELTCTETRQYIENSVDNFVYDDNGEKEVIGAGITYFPLSVEINTVNNTKTYSVDTNNSGYIIGAEWDRNNYDRDVQDNDPSNLRISEYDPDSIDNPDKPYTITYKTEGKFKEITSQDAALMETLGLVKYAQCFNDYHSSISDNCYGLHFMDAPIMMENRTEITAYLRGKDPMDNYQVPTNCIDFHLFDKGFINAFAGTYYVQRSGNGAGTENDSIFSLYQIFRNPDNEKEIIDIKEIKAIYAVLKDGENGELGEIDTSRDYHYVYVGDTDTEIPEGYYSEPVFDCSWITNTKDGYSATWAQNRAYYFEIPVNAGEYALGSTAGKTGAYLVYLDLAANAQVVERTREYEKIDENKLAAAIPNGVELLEKIEGEGSDYDTSTIKSTNSAFVSITPTASGAILFEKTDETTFEHSATSGTNAAYAASGTTVYDGNGNAMTIPPTATKTIERTTYRDYNLTTGEITVTVITKTTVTENGQQDVTYTRKITTSTPNGDGTYTTKTNEEESLVELLPTTDDPESMAKPQRGADFLKLAFAYGQAADVTISYEYTPATESDAPIYRVNIENPGDEAVTVKAILTDAAVSSTIRFFINDEELDKTTDAQSVTVDASAAQTPEDPAA